MGVIAITKSLCRKSLFIALSFTLALSSNGAAWADNNATLSKLEKWLFFATFSGESDQDRLKRIEEKTFGEAAEGSVGDRLSKVDQILSQRQKEKDDAAAGAAAGAAASSSSAGGTSPSKPDAANDPGRNFGGSPGAGSGSSAGNGTGRGSASAAGSGSSPNSGSSAFGAAPPRRNDDPEAIKDRQRIAVQAAREQEMRDLLQEGARLWRSRQGQPAVEKFDQVLRLDPQNPDAHFSIGVIQESLGKLKDAKAHYLAAAQSNPDNRDYQDAVNAVNKRLQAGPSDPNKALTLKANEAFKRGEYISAVNLYKQLEEKEPKSASVKFSLGTTFLMMKDPFNALENFKVAHQLEPNNPKYASAFNDLTAEMAKHQEAQQNLQTQYQGGGGPQMGNSGAVANAGGGKKGKDKKQKSQNAPNTAGGQMPPGGNRMQYGGYPQGNGAPYQQQQMPGQMSQQMPMQQRPMMQQPMQQGYGGGQNPYGAAPNYGAPQNYGNTMSQGTYIPPDPQAYATSRAPAQQQQMPPQQMMQQQMPPQQMSQQMPPQQMPRQQMPQQQMPQQQMPQQQMPRQQMPQQQMPQQQMPPQQMSQQMPPQQMMQQQMPSQQISQQMPSQQFGGDGMQYANSGSQSGSSSKGDAMSSSGMSGHGSSEGVLLTSVRGGSRAAHAGLKKGDVIRTVDGNEVMQPAEFNKVMSQYDSSQTLPLLIFRDGVITPIQF